MNIFDLIKNERFFSPLNSKNRRIYFECIVLLIDKAKELPVLYESDARDCITMYLKNNEYDFQDEQHLDATNIKIPEKNASMIMSTFRDCSWVTPKEIGRNGENVANIDTNCRRIIEFLRKMYEKSNEGAISNHIFSMYEILKSSFEQDSARAERPYSNILKPLIDHEVELKNELFHLKDNIADIMRTVMAFQDVNSVGKFLMKDELLDQFFSDYFFIKNNGLIPSQIAFIKNKLREIGHGELRAKMIIECMAQLQIEEEAAQEKIDAYLSQLQYFLTIEYEEHMELIDTRINTYYNLANTRMMLVMSNGINMESTLDAFLNEMKKMASEDKGIVLDKLINCTMIGSQKYISRKSYEQRRRKERDDSSIGLTIDDISSEEKEKRTKALIDVVSNRFSIEGVNQFFTNRMRKQNQIELKSQQITSREDAMMFAASIMYANLDELPYEIELQNDHVETDIAKISNMKIRKKRGTHE